MCVCFLFLVKNCIVFGELLFFSVCDLVYMLLLVCGQVIVDEEQLYVLFWCGVVVEIDELVVFMQQCSLGEWFVCCLVCLSVDWEQYMYDVCQVFVMFVGQLVGVLYGVIDFLLFLIDFLLEVVLLQIVCQLDGGSVYYGVSYLIYVVVVCFVVVCYLGWQLVDQCCVFQVVLMMNILMLELQVCLVNQVLLLIVKQCEVIYEYLLCSVEMLCVSGIVDEDWFQVVLQYYELFDGFGYLCGVVVVGELVEMFCFVDIYIVCLSVWVIWLVMSVVQVGCELYQIVEVSLLVGVLIKVFGIFLLGSMVCLVFGELGIVVCNGEKVYLLLVVMFINVVGEFWFKLMMWDSVWEEYVVVVLFLVCVMLMWLMDEMVVELIGGELG